MEDCEDQSDETDCNLVTIPDTLYRKEYPPIDDTSKKTNVSLSVALQELGSFQELSMSFKAKFYIQLRWFDRRLRFENLKANSDERNSIGKS